MVEYVDLLSSDDEEPDVGKDAPRDADKTARAPLLAPLKPAEPETAPEAAIHVVEAVGRAEDVCKGNANELEQSKVVEDFKDNDAVLRTHEDDHLRAPKRSVVVGDEIVDEDEDAYEADDIVGEWESESTMEDILEAVESDEISDEETAALPENVQLVKKLHELGPHEFVAEYLESGQYTAKRLCVAFGFPDTDMVAGLPEDHDFFLKVLGKLFEKELKKRRKLPQYNTIDDAVKLLQDARNILVLTGAGISTSLGIPDFRSANGLYAQLEKNGLADRVDDPQDVFSLQVFYEDPTIFYSVAKEILSSNRKFSPTHAFIKLLQDKDKLLTNYTQNIDNLEAYAGIQPDKLIHCHGSFATATCQECGQTVPGDSIYDEIHAGTLPRCENCISRLRELRVSSVGRKRKRGSNGSHTSKKKHREEYEDSSSEEDLSDDAAGIMKPDIVFFGEDLPDEFHERLVRHDRDLVDLVIVIGTSLKVAPVSEVPGFLPAEVPQIYISRDPCNHINFDIDLLGECDLVVAELCKRAGWELKHGMIPADQQVETKLVQGWESRHLLKRKVKA